MKNILILCPSLAIHGGIRVLWCWAEYLTKRGHNVTFQVCQPSTYRWNHWLSAPTFKVIVGTEINLSGFDIAVAGFPSAALLIDQDQSFCKKFFFLQMAEHLFSDDPKWHQLCYNSYQVKHPIIGISKWVEDEVRQWRGDGTMYYVGNGVSDEFKPGQKDEGLTVLVEGWGGYPGNNNQAKDVDLLACRVAEVLHREYGAKIIAFSQFPLFDPSRPNRDLRHARQYEYILSEYHEAPSGEELVRLYQRPTFMLKASKYDARSCAPVEAMKCGTVTVRAIERGDDDLIDGLNCFKVGYNFHDFVNRARYICDMFGKLKDMEQTCIDFSARELSWETRISEIENILLNG